MRKKTLFPLLFVFFVVGLVIPQTLAQNKAASPSGAVKIGDRYYKRKTVISFGEDAIRGDLTRPDGEYMEARKRTKHKKLIRLREHWKKKIVQSVNDL